MSRGHYSRGIDVEDDALIAVGAGKVPGVSSFNMQAFVNGVSQSGQDLVDWVDSYIFPSDSGELFQVVSTSAADTAIPVVLVGLDTDFMPQTETVIIDGLTPVATTKTWTRINLADVLGSVRTVGFINIRHVSGTPIYCQIDPVNQISRAGVYTTPANKASQILSLAGSMIKTTGNADVGVDVNFDFRRLGGVFKRTFSAGLQRRGSTTISLVDRAPTQLPGVVDIKLRAQASGNDVNLSVRVAILLQDPV